MKCQNKCGELIKISFGTKGNKIPEWKEPVTYVVQVCPKCESSHIYVLEKRKSRADKWPSQKQCS